MQTPANAQHTIDTTHTHRCSQTSLRGYIIKHNTVSWSCYVSDHCGGGDGDDGDFSFLLA